MPRCTASAVRPSVSPPTMRRVSQSVTCPNRLRPRWSSCPSCAMAEEGASTPVASAIATGNARATESQDAHPCVSRACSVSPAGPPWGTGRTPLTNRAIPVPTKARVRTAKTVRPPCPNQVRPGHEDEQTKRHHHAQGSQCGEIGHDGGRACRHTNRDGEDEIDHQGANGRKAQASPKAAPVAAANRLRPGNAPRAGGSSPSR